MKRIVIIIVLCLLAILVYRLIFSYRIVALANDGDLKYKVGTVTYFARPPLSIINPFKKGEILNKINSYCQSSEFGIFYEKNNYQKYTLITVKLVKKLALDKSFIISAIKEDNRNLIILVSSKTNNEFELVFTFDPEMNEIVGFY